MRWEPVSNAFPDAHALVETITAGWNLGDTLDSNVGQAPASIRHNTPQRQETFWENQITTEENILTVRNAGFNAIRIPVTWFAMVDDNLHIRGDWLDRVQTVVDYAYENGMIVILNTHHDESMWSLFDADRPKSRAVIETVWQQIATRFSGYSQRLIFEGLNEPRTVGSADEWSGGTEEERNNVNILNQVFVDTVRATGGNNANRFLITSPYAASATAPAIEGFVLPTDPAGTNQIIVSIHMYEPYPFAHSMNGNVVNEWSADGVGPGGPDAIVDGLERAFHTFVERGVPVIFGEMGALNRDNQDSRVAWAQFYVEQARLREMRTFWWDNGGIGLTLPGIAQFGLFDRRTNQATQPELIAAIMSAVDATP
jgi:endoglucanase